MFGLGGIISSAFKAIEPISGFLGDAATAYGGARQAEMTRDFNAEQANISREAQLELANTQYQRTVKDLNAAGLSPMMAYTKGATAMPSAVTASSGATSEGPKFGETSQRGAAAALANEQVNLAKSQRDVNVQTAKQVAEQARKTAYEVDTMMPTQLLYDMAVKGSQITANNASAGSAGASQAQLEALEKLTREGKAPTTDSNITRTFKDMWNAGVEAPNKFFNDMIGNVYSFGKSKLKGK
jgi:hypothetical protein